jgi:hypothetical protein
MPDSGELNTKDNISLPLALINEVANPYFAKEMFEVPNIYFTQNKNVSFVS